MRLSMIYAAAALVAACSSHDREPTTARVGSDSAPAPRKENRVIDVKTQDDLYALRSRYMTMCSSGFDGSLEIRFGPGPFAPVSWSLEPETPTGTCKVDLVLRGGGLVLPFPGRIQARSVRLEDAIFTGASGAAATFLVEKDFTMTRTSWVDLRLAADHWPGSIIEIRAEGGKAKPTNVTIEDCWFVRNFQSDDYTSGLLGLVASGPSSGYFDQVAVRRSAFLGNAFMYDLNLSYSRVVTIEDSLFYRTWHTGNEVRCAHCGDVTIKRSRMIVEKIDQVASVEDGTPIGLSDSKVMVRDWKGGATPSSISANAGQIVDRKPFEANEGVVSGAISQLTTQPLRAPAQDLWSKLAAAVGG